MLPTNYSFINHLYDIYKQGLVLNNPQGLIFHKTQSNLHTIYDKNTFVWLKILRDIPYTSSSLK